MDDPLSFLKLIPWQHIALAILVFSLGYFISKKASAVTERVVEKHFTKHHAMLAGRIVFYGLFMMFLVSALHELGFKLTVLLGTAGLFTVGLSFASQTAASNLISGIFLIFERPFKVGDEIAINTISGTVQSIEWLSTKIKTSDNKLIRIPNEALIKSEITNLSTYPQKRGEIDLKIKAAHDVAEIKTLLKNICTQTSSVLSTPESKVLFSQLIDGGGIELKLFYWCKSDLSGVRDELLTAIKKTFEIEKIAFVQGVNQL